MAHEGLCIMSSSVDEHRSWLAMRYVLGELSESDRNAFEVRMADDLTICEAVTAASRLLLATRAALELDDEPSATRAGLETRPGHSRIVSGHSIRGSWLAFAATSVAMAVLCAFALQVPVRSPQGSNVAGRDPVAAELVSLWRSGMNAGDAESDDPDDVTDASGDVAVPGWMLAAVSFEAGAVDGPSEKVQEN